MCAASPCGRPVRDGLAPEREACLGNAALSIVCLHGERVAVTRENAMQCAYFLGILEDMQTAHECGLGGGPGAATATLKAPLEAEALRVVLRILQGARADAVLTFTSAVVRARLRQPADPRLRQQTSQALEALVQALMAASYVHAPVAEDAIGKHFARCLSSNCTTAEDVCTVCDLEIAHPSAEDTVYIRELLSRASLFDPQTLMFGRAAPPSTAPWVEWPEWWKPPRRHRADLEEAVDASSSTAADVAAVNSTGVSAEYSVSSPHEALCLGGLSGFNAQSPLRCVSEDVLVLLVRMVGAVVVPDDLSLAEAIACTDYKTGARRILVRAGVYIIDASDAPLRVSDDCAILVQALSPGSVVVETDALTLLHVGGAAAGRLRKEGGGCVERGDVEDWTSLFLHGVLLRQTRHTAGNGGEGLREGAQHMSVESSGEGGAGISGAGGDCEPGYWAGGPVVLQVGQRASVLMSESGASSERGTAVLVQGETPGHAPYVLEQADDDGHVGEWGLGDGSGAETAGKGRLLPYGPSQLIAPSTDTRQAFALITRSHFGPCRGEVSTGVVAGMHGRVVLHDCEVSDIGLDGVVAAVGGRLEAVRCLVQACGESGLVASGVSTYELCRRSGQAVSHAGSCPGGGLQRGVGVGVAGPESYEEGAQRRCSECRRGSGRLVERSLLTAHACEVRNCGEEGLWACESGLLEATACVTLGCSSAWRQVTGGLVHRRDVSHV